MLDKTKLFPHDTDSESNQTCTPNEKIEYKNKQCHYIIKIIFSESHMEFDSAMVLIGNTKDTMFSSIHVAVDGNLDIDITTHWSIMIDEVKDRRKEVYERRSKYNNVIDRFELEFGKSCPISFVKYINETVLTTSDDSLLNLLLSDKFKDKINEILGHGLDIDEISINIDKKYYEGQDKRCEEKTITNIKMEEIYLDVIPVIDPVYGIKIENYNVGQNIIVKIIDETPLGHHLAKALSYDSPDGSVNGSIFEINKHENKDFNKAKITYEIIVKFDDYLKGSFEIENGVKIKNKSDMERVKEYKILSGELIEHDENDNYVDESRFDYKMFIFFIIIISILGIIILTF